MTTADVDVRGLAARIPGGRLERASLLLMLTTVLNAGLGLGFWLAAARAYDAATVGLAAAAVSALTLVSSFGWFGLQHVLLRYLPVAGRLRGRLIAGIYLSAIAIALGCSGVFLTTLTGVFDAELLSADAWATLGFSASVVAWVCFSLQDPVLIALGRPGWVPVENAVYGTLKLVVMVVLAQAGVTSAWAIFGAWTACAGVLVVAMTWLLTRRVLPAEQDVEVGLPSRRRLARFAAGHQTVAVTASLPDFLVPLLVLALVSKAATAHYYAAFTIGFALRLLAVNIASALTVEGARSGTALAPLVRRVGRLGIRLLLPLALFTLVTAGSLLRLFGEGYGSSAATVLRCFALALPCSAVIVVGLAIERVRERWGTALLIAALSTGTTIALDLLLLGTNGIAAAGVAWLVGQAVGAAATAALVIRPVLARPGGAIRSLAGVSTPARERMLTVPGAAAAVLPIALLAAGVLVPAGGIAGAGLHLDGLGLIRSLPVWGVAGLVALPLATAAEALRARPRAWLVGAPVLVFVLLVWLLPLVLEGTPRFRTSYQSWSYVDPLVRGDGLLPHRFVYHNWPAFPALFAALSALTPLHDTTIMAAFTPLIMLVWLGLTVVLVRTLVPDAGPAGVAMAAWVTAVANWTNQDYFSPQALAFALFLGLLVLLARTAVRDDGRPGRRTVAGILAVYAAIVVTHALTAMIALGVVAALTLGRLLRRRGVVLALTLMFVTWQGFAASPFLAEYGPRLRETMLAAGDFLQVNAASRVSGSPDHLLVTRVRILVSLAIFAIAAAAAGVAWRRRREPAWRFAVVVLVALAVLTPVSAYGGEMLIRTLLFALPSVAVLVAAARPRGWVLAALAAIVVVLVPLHLVAHYGNEEYDHVSRGELAGFRFVADDLAPARIYGGYPAGAFVRSADLQWRNGVTPNATRPPSVAAFLHPEAHNWEAGGGPTYVALSRGDGAAAALFAGRPGFRAQVRAAIAARPREFIPVFRNPDIEIWRHVAPRSPR